MQTCIILVLVGLAAERGHHVCWHGDVLAPQKEVPVQEVVADLQQQRGHQLLGVDVVPEAQLDMGAHGVY